MTVALTLGALRQAIAQRRPSPGLVHHSDRGLQYASKEYVLVLEKHGMIPSMSRPGNPYDNASCESFMKTLKREEIHAQAYESLEQLRSNIELFIERYYNQQRLHSALGYRSPEEFEQQPALADCKAATMTFSPNECFYEDAGDGDASPSPDPIPAGTKTAVCPSRLSQLRGSPQKGCRSTGKECPCHTILEAAASKLTTEKKSRTAQSGPGP